MSQQTVVGCFDNPTDAQQAAQDVIAMGVDSSRVHLSTEGTSGGAIRSGASDKGFWESLKDALGFDNDDDADRYGLREAARRGETIVSVEADDNTSPQIIAAMQRHNLVDLDERARQWGQEGWAGYQNYEPARATAADMSASSARDSQVRSGEEAIPVVEEEIRVGKREVARGGVRVVSKVTERPVEEQINLREERVNVERRPVDRPLTRGDLNNAFQERTIEARETAEEAVVSKNARVVEEVVVNKEAGERTETIRDSVRRTDVDVQQLNESDARFRPAYEFADEISRDMRYHGRSFDEVETDLRTSYVQRYPNSRWDDVRDAIRSRFGRNRSDA
jgi:stress response protein YsnF